MDNENLKLAGIQLSNEGAQITWYDKSLEEPQTLALPDEGEDGLIRVPADAWKGALRGGRFGSQALTRFLTRIIEMIPGETEMQDLRICVTVPSLTRALGDHIVSCRISGQASSTMSSLAEGNSGWGTSLSSG